MNILKPLFIALGWIVDKFHPFPTEEYFERFVKPAWQRGYDLGIPDRELTEMWDWAWENANPTIIGHAPISLFHRRMDEWERTNQNVVK